MASGWFSTRKVKCTYVVEWLLSLTPHTLQHSDWLIEQGCLNIRDIFNQKTCRLFWSSQNYLQLKQIGST